MSSNYVLLQLFLFEANRVSGAGASNCVTSPFHINGETEFLRIPLKDVDPTKMHQLQKQMQIPRKRSQSAEKLTI